MKVVPSKASNEKHKFSFSNDKASYKAPKFNFSTCENSDEKHKCCFSDDKTSEEWPKFRFTASDDSDYKQEFCFSDKLSNGSPFGKKKAKLQ